MVEIKKLDREQRFTSLLTVGTSTNYVELLFRRTRILRFFIIQQNIFLHAKHTVNGHNTFIILKLY